MDFFTPGRCVGRFHTIDVKIALTSMFDLIKLICIHVVDDFFIHVITVIIRDILFSKNKQTKKTPNKQKKQQQQRQGQTQTNHFNIVLYNICMEFSSTFQKDNKI